MHVDKQIMIGLKAEKAATLDQKRRNINDKGVEIVDADAVDTGKKQEMKAEQKLREMEQEILRLNERDKLRETLFEMEQKHSQSKDKEIARLKQENSELMEVMTLNAENQRLRMETEIKSLKDKLKVEIPSSPKAVQSQETSVSQQIQALKMTKDKEQESVEHKDVKSNGMRSELSNIASEMNLVKFKLNFKFMNPESDHMMAMGRNMRVLGDGLKKEEDVFDDMDFNAMLSDLGKTASDSIGGLASLPPMLIKPCASLKDKKQEPNHARLLYEKHRLSISKMLSSMEQKMQSIQSGQN